MVSVMRYNWQRFICIITISFITAILAGCGSGSDEVRLTGGIWRAVLKIPGGDLPFNFKLSPLTNKSYFITIINGEEGIVVKDVYVENDSIFIRLPVYDSEIKALIKGDSLVGIWYNRSRSTLGEIPFKAVYGDSYRFTKKREKSSIDVAGKWEVVFSGIQDADSSKAIGEFSQKKDIVTGTFLTTTGDYRYLEGCVMGNDLFLSCFDGSHAFLFKAKINPDKTLSGEFWSGLHWHELWYAKRNNDFYLPDPYTLTYLKEGYTKLSFSFPDTEGNIVSLSDDRFKNKVVIVQIMGTWCPNCLDESTFLSYYYHINKRRGVEVIALDYEKTEDKEQIIKNIQRLKKNLKIDYKILIAGPANKAKAAETLPMLNHILSFPTTLFIDKKGEIRKIHTGFSGPATGEHYNKFIREFGAFVEELLQEESS